MALKLFTLISKNIKLLIRSRGSALIIILGPLLLILLISAAFNTANVYSIRVGTSASSYTPLIESLLSSLTKNQFTVTKTPSQTACIDGVKTGFYNLCAVFPDPFSIGKGTVTFYVDTSRQNIVYFVIDALSTELRAQSAKISTQLTQGIVETLEDVSEDIQDQGKLLSSIAENTRDADDLISQSNQKLLTLNLNYSFPDSSYSRLSTQISKLQPAQGENASTATETLRLFKQDVEDIIEGFSYVQSTQRSIVNNLGTVKVLLKTNVEFVDVLSTSFSGNIGEISSATSTQVSDIVTPLTSDIQPVSADTTHLNYLFPTLLALIVMFVGIFLASSLEIKEKISKVSFKNFITPTTNFLFFAGNFLTNMIIIFFQLLVLFIVGIIFFNDQLIPLLFPLTLMLLLISSLFVLFGMLIGNIFKSEETSMVASISVGFIFLFFSNTILPIEALPEFIRNIVSYNPFYASQFVLNQILLFSAPLSGLLPSLITLGIWTGGLFILVLLSKKFIKGTS